MSNKKKLIERSIENTDWITNFWFIDDVLYLTDSKFDGDKKILAKIDEKILRENIKIKSNIERTFIAHPNPVKSSFIEASQSNIEAIDYFDDYIFNVNKIKDEIYISFIKNNKESYVNKYDLSFNFLNEVVDLRNRLIIGDINGNLITKSIIDRTTHIEGLISVVKNFKKSVETKHNYVLLTDDNKIYLYNKIQKEFRIYKIFKEEVNICKFDNDSILISEKEKQITYIDNLKNGEYNISYNYYYRLDNSTNKLFVGKPLFIGYNVESYSLPLTFIE